MIFLAPEARSRKCLQATFVNGLDERDLPDGHGLVGVQVRLALGAEELVDLALALELAAELERRDSLLGQIDLILHYYYRITLPT